MAVPEYNQEQGIVNEPASTPMVLSDYTPKTGFLEFGSTSIKFYVVGLGGSAGGQVEKEVKVPWDLGYDVFQHSRISPRSVTKCLSTLRKLQEDYPEIPLGSVTAVGTAALREAQNAEVLQRVLWEELSMRIHIIEGGIEAFLLEMGFRNSIDTYPTGLFDLGGGSLELVEYLSPHSTKKTSLPVGAIRLHCRLKYTRDLFSYISEGQALVSQTIREHLVGQTPPYRSLIGTGGTVRAVVGILGKDEFTGEDIRGILSREIHGPTWEDMSPHRRKVLLPGLIAVDGLFTTLALDRIVYRTASVKRGLMSLMSLIPHAEGRS